MDTLDKVTVAPTTPISSIDTDEGDFPDTVDQAVDQAESAVEDAAEAVRRVNWWKIVGYAAAGLAIVGAAGGYAYWRNQQKKPASRLDRLKSQLGLAEVDFRDLKSTINRFDPEKLDQSRRQFGSYAKKATHQAARKVAELTR